MHPSTRRWTSAVSSYALAPRQPCMSVASSRYQKCLYRQADVDADNCSAPRLLTGSNSAQGGGVVPARPVICRARTNCGAGRAHSPATGSVRKRCSAPLAKSVRPSVADVHNLNEPRYSLKRNRLSNLPQAPLAPRVGQFLSRLLLALFASGRRCESSSRSGAGKDASAEDSKRRRCRS